MTNVLADIKVLVTRQPEYSQTLIQMIENLHGTAVSMPLFAIEPIESSWYEKNSESLQKCDLGIVVSKNAAKIILNRLSKDTREKIIWSCVGPATADYLNSFGLRYFAPNAEPFDSRGLIDTLLLKKFPFSKANINIFTGSAWDPYLGERCNELGAHVHIMPVYRRACPEISETEIQHVFNSDIGIDIILITCVTSLLNLQQLACDRIHNIKQLPILAISARIATTALEMGFINVYTSKGVSEADIMQCLIEWRQAK